MRLIVGAAIAALVLAGSAAAQTTETPAPAAPAGPPAQTACAAIPPAPTLPDGATATAAQITAGNEAFNQWMAAVNPTLTCRRDEAQAVLARGNSLREQFNASAQSITAVREGWVADVAEYQARNPRRGNR